jgi:hypothetical protein
VNQNFIIFHPSDFSPASEVAFGHALKIALQSKAKLDIMHVETHLRPEKQYWLDFPAVRATLTRWGILPEGARRDEVAKTGLRIGNHDAAFPRVSTGFNRVGYPSKGQH